MRPLRAIDLCCGCGGWAVAARGLPIEIVAAVDFNEDCCRTYRYNHPGVEVVCADVHDHETWFEEEWEGLDLVLGAIPCNTISPQRAKPAGNDEIAELRRLVDRLFELVEFVRPRWWCLEDVVQIRKHLPAPLLAGLPPYDVRVISSAGYSAQARKRAFLGCFPAPAPGECELTLGDVLLPGPHRVSPTVISPDATVVTMGGHCPTFGTVRICPAERKGPTVSGGRGRGSAVNRFTVRTPDARRRVFSWRECAVLQGFPEDYIFVGSRTSIFIQVNEAIQIDTGRAILEGICREAEER